MTKYKGVTVLEVLEGADNYNNWIVSRIKPDIVSPALEIGAGTGNISAFFKNLKSLTVTDNDETLVEKLATKFKGNKNVRAEVLDIEKDLYKVTNRFRTIYSVNVLEHIKNDEKALKNMHKLLEPGGKVVLLVPAKKFAYTNLDKDLGHHRRYEKAELKDKLTNAGFTVKSISYFNAVGLASWIIRDKISRGSKNLSSTQVKFFDMIVPVLKQAEPKKILPMGISLIGIGEKNE